MEIVFYTSCLIGVQMCCERPGRQNEYKAIEILVWGYEVDFYEFIIEGGLVC